MGRTSYKTNPLDVLKDLRDKVTDGEIVKIARGSMFFNQDGVIITDDAEDEFIPEDNPPAVVETEHAEELSWLMFQLKDGLGDVVSWFAKPVFYGRLADAANNYLLAKDDLRGLLLSVILEATILTAESMDYKNQSIKDEVLACVSSLSEVAEKI